jgi:hypothetical protein
MMHPLSRSGPRARRFASLTVVYHVELRQFPHNFCRFNVSERELRETILDAWARDEWVELGERKWSPHQAALTVLEGPRLPVEQLSMGRGWRNAQREGKDVTAELLAAAGQETGRAPGAESGLGPGAQSPVTPPGSTRPTPDPNRLASELLALLGDDPAPLIRAWQLALERHPDRTPSACLALAEDLLRG